MQTLNSVAVSFGIPKAMGASRRAASRFASGYKSFRERLRANTRGFAAVEFAMLVPVMVTMFLGSVEFSLGLSIDRRVTSIASATADLVAQSEQISSSDLADIMNIIDSLIKPHDAAKLSVNIVSVVADGSNNVTVDWSYNKTGGQPYPKGSPYNNMPAGLTEPFSSVVVAEVSYDYDPPVGKFIAGTITLSEKFYLRPRKSLKVEKVN